MLQDQQQQQQGDVLELVYWCDAQQVETLPHDDGRRVAKQQTARFFR